MAFNEPLMLEPAYARVFFCALAGQLGISRLTDAVSGDSLTAQEAPATLALSGDDDGPRQARSYQVMNGIAVLPVSGTLVSRTRALQPYSGMTGYNGIIARLQQAASDPMVDGILLDMDTPGGMVAGAFDCADIIARVRDIKPVWALANDMNCSAGQLLASAASRRLVTQTARTGSIGVMMAHSNYGAALEKQGVEITLIYSGSHKVDGNPYSHLPDDVREGNTNISGVTVVFRAGEQEQTPPEGFESSGSETVLGTEVKYDTPITRAITSANIDRLRFTFGVQALVETTSKGDRNPSEVRLLVQIQRNGGWVTEKDITIKGKTTSQYLASVVVDNLPPRPFNIRMRRMTPDSTTDQLQNKTLWSSYTEIIDVKQCYPNTALVGV
ncbi:S49 family peptidase, partial [Escherichia coli]|uniref:S49 family peptidase n=1 Tax=Escherichia coli TaxID=562 RepID=UPI003B504115